MCRLPPRDRDYTFSLFSHFLQKEASDHKAFIALAIDRLISLHKTLSVALENLFWIAWMHSSPREMGSEARTRIITLSDWQDAISISNNWHRDDERQQE